MSTSNGGLAVIGVGNVLLGDDGAGVRVIDVLRHRPVPDPGAVAGLPPETRLIDGGTLGLGLLGCLEGVRGLVLVDAGDRGEAPGTVTVHRGADAIAAATADDAGHHGVGELLTAARALGTLPRAVSIVEVAVARIEIGVGLSPGVEAAVPAAVTATCRELVAMGQPPTSGRRPRAQLPAGASA